jgi:hypothetical protein
MFHILDNVTMIDKDNSLQVEKVPEEIGGFKGEEPTKYGDWQHRGRVSDF